MMSDGEREADWASWLTARDVEASREREVTAPAALFVLQMSDKLQIYIFY